MYVCVRAHMFRPFYCIVRACLDNVENRCVSVVKVQVDDIGPRFSAVDTDRKQLQLDVTALKSELDALGVQSVH